MRFTIAAWMPLLLAAQQQPIPDQLREVARVATAMLDGDQCRRIVSPKSIQEMFAESPRDKFAASDNYTVDHEAFIQVKKTLIRLSTLASTPCDVNLWMPLPKEGKIHIVIRNVNEMSQFWTWGALFQDMHPAMKSVLSNGRPQLVQEKPGMISILAPVRDSLGDIAGLVEVVARTRPDSHENVR
jgi:hypothetical protein